MKQNIRRALVDLSSLVWTNLLGAKDKEFGREIEHEGKKFYVNSAQYCYDKAIDFLLATLQELHIKPRDVILVMEGMNSKAMRRYMYPGYKADRDGDRCPQQYEQFNLAKEMIVNAMLSVGANMAWQDGGVEADDVLGYLAQKLKGEIWIISNDKDLAQLIGKYPESEVHQYRMGTKDENPFGPFNPRLIPAAIALVGDSADKIPGASRFGEKTFIKLLETFGEDGLEMMDELIKSKKLHTLAEDVGEMKELQRVIDSADQVYLSYALANLLIPHVDTLRRPLQWKAGMVKSRAQVEDTRLHKFAGVVRLITAENYIAACEFLGKHLEGTPYFALDIETSTPEASDDWLEAQDKDNGKVVDVFGSELTGLGLTFGDNMQFTYYLTHDHVEVAGKGNLTREQVRDLVDMLPREKLTVVHNSQFELPVLFNTWGKDWESDPVYHGFLRNVVDSAIMSSYVNENVSRGLKSLSASLLDYDQVTYEQVTRKGYNRQEWDGVGRVVDGYVSDDGVEHISVMHKMNQLTADHVLSYGADDCICTAALANYFMIQMEIENVWNVFMEVEQFPAYLTAKAFIDGADFSLEEMRRMEEDDNKVYDESWSVLRQYLIDIGYEGVNPPEVTELTPATFKLVISTVTGYELKTQVRTMSKLYALLEKAAEDGEVDEEKADLIVTLFEASNLEGINQLLARFHDGEPKLDLASPKQMKHLLYERIGIPVQIVNDITVLERKNNPLLASAVNKHKKIRSGDKSVRLTDEESVAIRAKAKTDDTAIEYAMAFDADHIDESARKALLALGQMKRVMTRRSLFYKNYRNIRHWKDGKIHANVNQCGTVTRRYSSSNPNLQQLPKKGEGVRFRGCFKPHHKDAVICSIDFSGQELRLAAERSQDKNMLACYIGDKLKDIHSITAAGAMKLKWGINEQTKLFNTYGADLTSLYEIDPGEGEYSLFVRLRKMGKETVIGKQADDLRKDSKNVNFAAQFGGKAAKLSETLIMSLDDAQLFLDARSAMFPDVDKAATRAEEFAQQYGYTQTMLGVRRHLRDTITSDDRGTAARAARQGWNMEIQGSAAEMTKLAMARFWKSDVLWTHDVRFIAPIHDELVTSINRKDVVEVTRIKHECMVAQYANMKVPVLGSISIGPDFAHQHECGDWYIQEEIEKAVSDIFKV